MKISTYLGVSLSLVAALSVAPAQAAPTPSPTATTPGATTPIAASTIAPTITPTTAATTTTPQARTAKPANSATATHPTATTTATAEPSAAASSQAIKKGQAAEIPANIAVSGEIGKRFQADGGYAKAPYGKPTATQVCEGTSCFQQFEGGTLVYSPVTGVHLVKGAFAAKWLASGALKSSYGLPSAEEVALAGGAYKQAFSDGGEMYWTPWGTGTRYVNLHGGIGNKWATEGGYSGGTYGFPTSEEECGFALNSCVQRFEKATIVWTPAYGSVRITGAIRTYWEASGGMKSPIGVPVHNEDLFSNGNAAEQLFRTGDGKDGAVYWTAWGTGTHYVKFAGAIGNLWANNGNFRAAGTDTPQRYGYPTSDEVCANGRCYQKYQYGVVTWDNYGGGTHGYEMQKCVALNNGRSKYSPQGAARVALALNSRYSNYRKDPGGYQGMFYSCKNVYGTYVLDWKTQASFGENGFLAPWKRIHDYETGELLPPGVTGNTAAAYSPTGSYTFSNPFGLGNPGSGFSGYHTLNPSSRWGGDRNTWYYNTYIENAALGYPNENMWNFATRGDYRQGILINYNKSDDGTRTLSGNAGFAIMLHTIPKGSSVYQYPTWGCIAIAPERITQFLQQGRNGDRIIMGVESEVMNW